MKAIFTITLCLGSLPALAAAIPQPTNMSPACRASFDSAIPGLQATHFATGLGSFGDSSVNFMRRVVLDSYGSGLPVAVAGINADYARPICVAGNSDFRAYIPLDVLTSAVFLSPLAHETGFYERIYVDYRRGSKAWQSIVSEIEKSGRPRNSAESFRFLQVDASYVPETRKGSLIKLFGISDTGDLMGPADGMANDPTFQARMDEAIENTVVLLRRISALPEIKQHNRNYAESRKQSAEIAREVLGDHSINSALSNNWYWQLATVAPSKHNTVKIEFAISPDGNVEKETIAKSSGVSSLDLSAFQAVERVGNFSSYIEPEKYTRRESCIFSYDKRSARCQEYN